MRRREFMAVAGSGAAWLAFSGKGIATVAPATEDTRKRAAELVSKMSFDEKVLMMGPTVGPFATTDYSNPYRTNNTHGCERLGIPGIRFADGSRGIRFTGATCFPCAMARGATWDRELEKRVGSVIGYEGRAGGANFFGGVCINVLRHPSWGRSQETFGEDTYHLGRMGSATVTGVQNHMMACTKHFTANSIDLTRHIVDVSIDERTLREIYFPHFKACVDAGTASVMNAYNSVNGKTCSANKRLLTDVLKEEWGFPGFVLSDFGSIKSTIPAARAGCDVEMDRRVHYDWKLKWAVKTGLVDEARIDDAVTRIVSEQLRFIHLEDDPSYKKEKLGNEEHATVARETSEKSMVLLKNEDNALPLSRKGLSSIAVIGELADMENLGATGSTAFTPAYVIKPLDGIKNAAGNLEVIYDDGTDPDSAARKASSADAAIVVTGLTAKDENEGSDRLRLELPEEQEDLIKKVAAANSRTIVVIQGGGAVVMESWRHDVPAILMSWYSGMEGGNAVGRILFGDANPSGKLPITFPKSKDQLPPFNNKSLKVEYGYYHGYRWFDKNGLEPAYYFGHGLSYTSHKYSDLSLDRKTITPDGSISASFKITNTGDVASEEVAQLYVSCKNSRVHRPVKDLKAFAKVALAPGETKTVRLSVPARDLAFYDVDTADWEVEKTGYRVLVGPSADNGLLMGADFEVA